MKVNKVIKILFVTNNQFPIGMALTNRILSLAIGISTNGFEISVLCVRPTEEWDCIINSKIEGIYEGIPYKYAITQVRSKYFLYRRLNDFLSILNSFIIIRKEKRHKKLNLVFFGHYPVYEFLLALFGKIFHVAVSKEESEYPLILFRQNIFGKLACAFSLKVTYRLFSNIFIMTDNLILFFKSHGISANKLYKLSNALYLPIFRVRTSYDSGLVLPSTYIAFSGTYNDKKDGILSFLKVFKIVNFVKPEIKLVVIGDGNETEKRLINERILELALENQVYLLGKLSSEYIPFILIKALTLISYRPSSLQAEYGFPTKLIEYLSTGKPVISTFTGEIGKHLINKYSAFEITFGEIQEAGNIIIGVLDNYDLSLEVGKRGSELVANKFNAEIVSKRMISILTN